MIARAGSVAVLVPQDVDAVSGGNIYDRRIASGLVDLGWQVDLLRVPQDECRAQAGRALNGVLATLPDGTLCVVDGLVGHQHPGTLARHSERLTLVSLVHLLLCDEYGLPSSESGRLRACEHQSLSIVRAVVVTSAASRRRLSEAGMRPHAVEVVEPGTEPATTAHGTDGVHQWLCPAAVTPHKDQAGLLEALQRLSDIPWRCRCVGPLDRAPQYAADLAAEARRAGLADRFLLVGARTGRSLAEEFAGADLVVLPSRFETYGMALAEALAHGIPVVSTTAGGIPETVGEGCGLLVPPGDPAALADALRRWVTDPGLRRDLRAAVRSRPASPTWDVQARRFADVLVAARSTSPDGARP
jgi:glycosyltransferase involved in cell wall biosynthesis